MQVHFDTAFFFLLEGVRVSRARVPFIFTYHLYSCIRRDQGVGFRRLMFGVVII